ncbi:glycosyltransferase family 4 protein [Inediibacterium massiliense]|uniref:glycosyltransferase family 4 protein n=1 Tax=Inediibacterium massiliense TaxID=1658111 RepID=UPI0018FE7EA7|nr:glycosyltransferase family 1 protein [Inediibacterium massiliense]
MEICLDGLCITHLTGTGLYTYAYELYNHLFRLYGQPNYHIIWDDSELVSSWEKNKKLTFEDIPINRIQNDYRILETYLKGKNIQLYHSLHNGFSIPNKKVCPYITTVHDVSPFYKGYDIDSKYENNFFRKFPNAMEKSDYIIAVSDFLKKQIVQQYPQVKNKVVTIYPGIGECFYETENQTKNMEKTYLLHVGSMHTRKNIEKIMDVCELIFKENKELKLLIVGKNDGKREEDYLRLKYYAHQLNIQDHVVFTGEISYKNMVSIYRKSLFLFNFSKYEGFPFSALEALACGVPVVCRKTDFMQEILKQSPIYVDENDPNKIKNKILELKNNQKEYKKISEEGRRFSQKYNWGHATKKIVQIYEKAMYG